MGRRCTAVPSKFIAYIHWIPSALKPSLQARGDVPSLTFSEGSGFNGTVALSVAASLEGIAPLWGTFEIQYGGETTNPLYVDATAGETLYLAIRVTVDLHGRFKVLIVVSLWLCVRGRVGALHNMPTML